MGRLSLEERFWSKVDIRGNVECWAWIAAASRGRARFRMSNPRRWEHASRVCWELVYGFIPADMSILHHCDNGLCVNPEHLWLGTQQDNIADCIAKGRYRSGGAEINRGKVNCPQGHEYTNENTYFWRKMRFCQICRTLRNRARVRV